MLVFSTGFVNYCPFSMVSSPPFPHCVNKYTVYTYTVCKGGGGYGVIRREGALIYNDICQCFLSV
jgi:hypothetical protein